MGTLAVDIDLHEPDLEPSPGGSECIFEDNLGRPMCVQYFCPPKEVSHQPHTLSEYTILVCLTGRLILTEQGRTQAIGPGGIVISNAGVEHAVSYLSHHLRTCEVVCLSFDGNSLADLVGEFQWLAADREGSFAFVGTLQNEFAYHYALDIVQELRKHEAGHQKVVSTLALLLLFKVMRSWPRDQIESIAANRVPRLTRRDFVRACEFMCGCRKETFRLQALCRYLGISQERFNRLFSASTNVTPANFYNRMLLERGRELLGDKRLSIKEISFELGFKTTSHFGVAFRREFAASPQEYRQRKQAKT